MIKWQADKKPGSHSVTYVFLTAFHSIPRSLCIRSLTTKLLCSATEQTTQAQSDPARFFCFFRLQYNMPHTGGDQRRVNKKRATHMHVLRAGQWE